MLTNIMTWKLVYFRKGQKFQMSYRQPAKEFSNRHHVNPIARSKNAEDAALVKHIHASLYPFDAQPTNPCFRLQMPSRKLKSYSRGTFSTATHPSTAVNNWGFVYITPVFCSDPTINECAYSAGSVVGHDSFTNGTAFSQTSSPFTRATYSTSALQARPLSCSLRVRNITPMLSRGGTLYAVKSPQDTQLSAQPFDTLISDLDVVGHAQRCDTSGDGWQTISWCPRDVDQMEYVAAASAQNFNSAQMLRTIAFVAQAPGSPTTVANQQTYEWEAVWHFDVIADSSLTDYVHSSTRGIAHPHIEKVQQIISDLHVKPQIIMNPASNVISGFITDIIDAGHGVDQVVNAVCDLASKTAAIAPSVYRRVRALGSFL